MVACGMAPLGLESRERAQTAGGCVAVFLRLRGCFSRSSGSTTCRHCYATRSLTSADDLTSRPGHQLTSDLASTTPLGHGPGRPAVGAAMVAEANSVGGSRHCCALDQGAPPPSQEGEKEEATRRRWRLRRPLVASAALQLFLLLLLSSVLRIAECCSSRANPRPRSPSPSTRRPYTFQTQPCPAMYREHYCRNGATCFKVTIGHSPLYNCECTDEYMGQRCQFKALDGTYSGLRRRGTGSRDAILETASIAGGAGVALLVCVLLAGLLYVWSKRRRKQNTATPVRFSLRHQLSTSSSSSSSHVVVMDDSEPAANETSPPRCDVTTEEAPQQRTAAADASALVDPLVSPSDPQSMATDAPP